MGILELCEQYFATRNIYELLELEKDASSKDLKKAYYKLSLQVHPDRVSEEEKPVATEKFKVLSKIYQVLTDKDKRALYDEQGIIDDEDDFESKLTSWLDLWRKIFKPITEEEISNYEKSYIGSELERTDIKKAYLSGKGCINHMMNSVPFFNVKDEPRLQEIVREMITAGEVPEYEIFTNEPTAKRKRRHQKYAREGKEAAEIKKKLNASNEANSLEQQIMARQQSREDNYKSLMDKLIEKYGEDDDSTAIDFDNLGRKKKKKSAAGKNNVSNGKGKSSPSVKSGKVKKRKA